MKENARKLLAKVGITRSFPNGKRSVNAGIHAIFLDSAVFTVSENAGKRPQKAGFHSLTAVNSRFSRLKTQGKCRNTRRSPSVNRSVNVSKRMFTGVHWIGKLMDNGTNTRINRSENVWKTKDFPLGESQKMRVNCAFFVNSPRVFSVGKCHFFCCDCLWNNLLPAQFARLFPNASREDNRKKGVRWHGRLYHGWF